MSCFDGRVLTCRPLWAMTCRPRTLSVVAAVLVVLVKPFAVHFYLEHLPSSSTAIWQLEVACELLKPVRPPSLLPRSRMRHEGTDQDVGDPALIGLGCFVAPKAPLVTKQFLAWLAAPGAVSQAKRLCDSSPDFSLSCLVASRDNGFGGRQEWCQAIPAPTMPISYLAPPADGS